MTSNDKPPLIKMVDEIRAGNEQRTIEETPDKTKQDLSEYVLDLMATESAINSAS